MKLGMQDRQIKISCGATKKNSPIVVARFWLIHSLLQGKAILSYFHRQNPVYL